MNATFNIKVNIDSNNVSTSFSSEKNEDMDITLLTSVLKVFSDVQNRVKAQVSKYYGISKEQPETTANEEAAPTASETVDEKPEGEQ